MKIAIFTLGTRGDVQPFLALAVGLQRAGHQVTLAASYNFTDWIQSHGVQVHPISWSVVDFLRTPEVKAAFQSRNIIRILKITQEGLGDGFIQANDDLWRISEEVELVIQTFPLLCGVEVAQQRNLPIVNAYATPVYTPPTRAFSWFGLPWRFSLGGTFNYLSHVLLHNSSGSLRALNQWRTSRLNLPPIRSTAKVLNPDYHSGTPSIYGHSPSVLPKPDEWSDKHHVTGYWFLDSPTDFQPPIDLLRFLELGQPPVYVGFGSMNDRDPERLTRLALRALELTGRRGVLETGWDEVKNLPTSDQVYHLDSKVPHNWLFPSMAAVVHHGGAGTTAAALRAGIPNIITPFILDQHAWAELVMKLGVGLRPVRNAKKLTAEKLARAIDAVVDNAPMRARTTELGESIGMENGIARAIEVIEHHAAEFRQQAYSEF